MKYRNYIFDLYGTLIDIHTDQKKPELWEMMEDYLKVNFNLFKTAGTLKKEYFALCKEEEKLLSAKNHSKYPEIQVETVFQRLLGKPVSDEKMLHLCTAFRDGSREWTSVYPGVFETFERIRKDGGKIYLLSNAQRIFTEKEMNDLKLTEHFDDIFISSDKGIKKPDSDFLKELMEKHQLAPEDSVMVGNEVGCDVGVAARIGIDAVLLNTFHQTMEEIETELAACGADPARVQIVEDGDITKLV